MAEIVAGNAQRKPATVAIRLQIGGRAPFANAPMVHCGIGGACCNEAAQDDGAIGK